MTCSDEVEIDLSAAVVTVRVHRGGDHVIPFVSDAGDDMSGYSFEWLVSDSEGGAELFELVQDLAGAATGTVTFTASQAQIASMADDDGWFQLTFTDDDGVVSQIVGPFIRGLVGVA